MAHRNNRVCVVCGVPLFNRIKLAMYCDACSDVLDRVRKSLFSCVMHSKLLRPLNEKYIFSFRITLRNDGTKDGEESHEYGATSKPGLAILPGASKAVGNEEGFRDPESAGVAGSNPARTTLDKLEGE